MWEQKIASFIAQKNRTVLLISKPDDYADQSFAYKVYEKVNKETGFCSIFIDLSLVDVDIEVVEKAFLEKKLTPAEITHFKIEQRFIFIFADFGYDGKLENIYSKYQLQQWCGKIIVICPHSLLHPTLDASIYFAPIINHRVKKHLLDRFDLPQEARKIESSISGDISKRITEESFPTLDSKDFSTNFLHQKLFTTDEVLLRLLAGKVQENSSFKLLLFKIIDASRENSGAAIAAANAITILNYARCSFAHMNLRGIKISYANLSGAVLYFTDLSHADLRHVNFLQANMHGANLENSDLKECFFGETSYLKLGTDITQCAYQPRRRKLAVTLSDSNVCIVDINSQIVVQYLQGHKHTVNAVDFHPNKPLVITGGLDTTIKVWDENTGICLQEIVEHLGNVAVVRFSKDGSYFASSGEEGDIYIWQTADYVCVQQMRGDHEEIFDLDFDNTNQYLISTNRLGVIAIWDLLRGRRIRVLSDNRAMVSYCVRYSPDNYFIAAAGLGEIYLWTQDGIPLPSLQGHTDKINSINFSDDGKYLISGSDDNSIRIWSLKERVCQRILRGHNQAISYAQFMNDNVVVSASSDATVRRWPLTNQQQFIEQNPHEKIIKHLVFSRDAKYLATADEEGTIQIRLVSTGQLLKILSGVEKHADKKNNGEDEWNYQHFGEIDGIEFSPDGLTLIASKSGFILSYQLNTNVLTKKLIDAKESPIRHIKFNPDGKQLFASTAEFLVYVYELSTMQVCQKIRAKYNTITSICINSNGKLIAIASTATSYDSPRPDKSGIQILELSSNNLIRSIDNLDSPIYGLAFSPDEGQLVGANANDEITFWSLATGRIDFEINEQIVFFKDDLPVSDNDQDVDDENSNHENDSPYIEDYQRFLRFDNNGKVLFSGDGARPIRVWSSLTGHLIALLDTGPSSAYALHINNSLKICSTIAGEYSIKTFTAHQKKFENTMWKLDWMINGFLDVKDCQIKDVKGLSEANYEMLRQRGVRGIPGKLIRNSLQSRDNLSSIEERETNIQGVDLSSSILYLTEYTKVSESKLFNSNSDIDFQAFKLSSVHETKQLTDFFQGLYDLGKAHMSKKLYKDALLYLIKAKQFADLIRKQSAVIFEGFSYEYNNLLSDLGSAAFNAKFIDQAKGYLRQAVVLKKNFIKAKNEQDSDGSVVSLTRDYVALAYTLAELGFLYYHQNEYAEAEKRLKEANKLFQFYYKQFVNGPSIMERISETLNLINIKSVSTVAQPRPH